jgi:hypothetical protein
MKTNRHKSFLKYLLAGLFLWTTNISFAQNADKIPAIRKTVEAINNDSGYQIRTRDNDYFAEVKNEITDNGQELKGYYKNGRLKKMVYSLGLSVCMKTYEYYFLDNELIFVFEKEDDYPEKGDGLDYSRLLNAFEARYYLDKGKVFETKVKGAQRLDEGKNFFLQKMTALIADLNVKSSK